MDRCPTSAESCPRSGGWSRRGLTHAPLFLRDDLFSTAFRDSSGVTCQESYLVRSSDGAVHLSRVLADGFRRAAGQSARTWRTSRGRFNPRRLGDPRAHPRIPGRLVRSYTNLSHSKA